MAINLASLLSDDEHRLLGRIDELYARADSGSIGFSNFLNMRERFIIENQRHAIFKGDDSAPFCFFWGGFPDSERALLCVMPSYCRYALSEDVPMNVAFRDELSDVITPLQIKTSGYVKLTHRDFLGADL